MAPEQHRGRIVGAYATIWSMGIAAGPLILKFIGADGELPFIVSGCLMAGAVLPLLLVPKIEYNHTTPARHLVLQMVYIAPVAMGAGFFSGFLETAVLALLPVYGLRSGIEPAYALILVSIFSVGSFVCQPFISWIADKVTFKNIAIFMFVMAYTAGMVVGPLSCSAAMQVAGPFGLFLLPAIAPAFFILLILRWKGTVTPGGNRI